MLRDYTKAIPIGNLLDRTVLRDSTQRIRLMHNESVLRGGADN